MVDRVQAISKLLDQGRDVGMSMVKDSARGWVDDWSCPSRDTVIERPVHCLTRSTQHSRKPFQVGGLSERLALTPNFSWKRRFACSGGLSTVQSHPILATTRQAKGWQEVDGVIAFEADQGNDYETIKVSNFVIPQVPSR